MKGQTYVILAIIFTIIISVFAVMNIEQVEVNYLFWSGSSPLIFVILFSVLLGGILTMVVGSKKYVQLKRKVKQLEQQLMIQNDKETIDISAVETTDSSISIPTEAQEKEDELPK